MCFFTDRPKERHQFGLLFGGLGIEPWIIGSLMWLFFLWVRKELGVFVVMVIWEHDHRPYISIRTYPLWLSCCFQKMFTSQLLETCMRDSCVE